MPQLEVFFDYICPYCYLGLHDLKELLPNYPALSIAWRPCEAHPRPEPRFTWGDALEWEGDLLFRIHQAGIPINQPHSPSRYSDKAIQGLLSLEDQGGNIQRYNEAVYAAVFVHGKNIEDLDVLSECALTAGADPAVFRQVLLSETYKEQQLELNRYAWEENALEAVPSFRVGDFRLNAAPGIGVLRTTLAEFLEKQASE